MYMVIENRRRREIWKCTVLPGCRVRVESLFKCEYFRLVLKNVRDVDNLRELGRS